MCANRGIFPFCLVTGISALFIFLLQADARPQTVLPSSQPSKSRASAKFHEDSVAKISGGSALEGLQSAGSHAAWVELNAASSKWTVRLDGLQQGPKYDGIKFLEFSPDGSHLAFFGERDSHWFLVLDGHEHSAGFSAVSPVVFQPKGNSWAYPACAADNECTLVINDQKIAPNETYQAVSPPVYSQDGKRFAYLTETHDKWTSVVDGKSLGPPMDGYSCLGFSPDAVHFFVCGATKKMTYVRWSYVLDGAPGPDFVQVGPIAFSNDGAHYAYGVSGVQIAFKKDETSGAVMFDGKIGTQFEGRILPGAWMVLLNAPVVATEIYAGSPVITPLLFRPVIPRPGERFLSVGLNGVSDPTFDLKDNVVYAAERGAKDAVVMDGSQMGPHFDDVLCDVIFTRDGLHSAYLGLRGSEFLGVVDGQIGKGVSIDELIPHKPVPTDQNGNPIPVDPPNPKSFSVDWAVLTPHTARFAYEVIDGGLTFRAGKTPRAHRVVVLDGQPGKRYNALGISTIHFSEDEKHYWYTVYGADGKRGLVVVDGEESKLYENITEAQFDKAVNDVVFFGRSGNRLLRITFPLN